MHVKPLSISAGPTWLEPAIHPSRESDIVVTELGREYVLGCVLPGDRP
jgi:hypothetical protein